MKTLWTILALLPFVFTATPGHAAEANGKNASYAFSFHTIDGAPLSLGDYRGKVVLVVNVASFCGFTSQYAGLQSLYAKFQDQGLVVLGVPANDFGGQEPGSNPEIKKFAHDSFNVTFPMTEKAGVTGVAAHPFFRWARDTVGAANAPRWNFHKYLIGRDGRLLGGYGSDVEPSSPALVSAITAALSQQAGG